MPDLRDRVVLVTGAAGHLGRALAQALRKREARLVLADVQLPGARDHGGREIAISGDLADPAGADAAVEAALSHFGRLDAVCHLAGAFRMGEPVHATERATWDFLMDTNVHTLLQVARPAVPALLQAGGGSIVAVGANAAARGGALMGAYAAAKGAVARLVESMSGELKDQGIRVNCVLPSILDTADNRRAMPEADFTRWVAPPALADVICFLLSDQSRAVHGASIPVTGRV